MMGERGKERGVASADPPQPHYRTLQGVSNYPPPPPPQPAIGFPQPVHPPGASEPYANAYQAVLAEDSMVKLDRICREANVMLVFAHSYGLTGFVRISVKHELICALYPVFVHCFMDLVAKGHIQEARNFFNSFREDHEMMHLRDPARNWKEFFLRVIWREMEFAHSLRQSKVKLKICPVIDSDGHLF
ncbi:unnamed protein product [Camellia sinensis]